MRFRIKKEKGDKESRRELRPFVFRTEVGFLLGLAYDPEKGSPCAGCVEKWLVGRGLFCERMEVGELRTRKDLIASLEQAEESHVLYEIDSTGTANRMEAVIFPHPDCNCIANAYRIAPERLSPNSIAGCFTFSPLQKVKCARYGVPSGNVWISLVEGRSTQSPFTISSIAIADTREHAKWNAFELWLKEAAEQSVGHEEEITHNIVTGTQGNTKQLYPNKFKEIIGIGRDRETAIVAGLHELAKWRVLKSFANRAKNPMLVVGSNNYVRERVPFLLLQQYDIHLLFYPNSMPTWVVGVAAISRVNTEEAPIFAFAGGANIHAAIDQALASFMTKTLPFQESTVERLIEKDQEKKSISSKLSNWWNTWLYRCPKISLRDVLHLEPYDNTVNYWRGFFTDGQYEVFATSYEFPWMPREIRYVVKIRFPLRYEASASNVVGLGSLSSLGDSL